ncbi:MAG: JAB domain-containing protein [Wolbachia sp.]
MIINKKGIQVIYMDAGYNTVIENTYGYECVETVQSIMEQILTEEAITSIKVTHYLTALEPSKEDLEVAKNLILILPNIEVELKDYIIVTQSGYVNLIE